VRTAEEEEAAKGFVVNMRSAAPYLRMHAGQVMVVHISSTLLGTPDFDTLLDDLALVKMLGVKLVLILSLRQQVNARLQSLGRGTLQTSLGHAEATDAATLQVAREMSGAARSAVEARLSRGPWYAGQAGALRPGTHVISGNLFFSAQPQGVRSGVDLGFSGDVRRVDVEGMRRHLDAGDVLLLTSIGCVLLCSLLSHHRSPRLPAYAPS
jgi:amino-acid N-acetyltransferase